MSARTVLPPNCLLGRNALPQEAAFGAIMRHEGRYLDATMLYFAATRAGVGVTVGAGGRAKGINMSAARKKLLRGRIETRSFRS